MHFGPPRSLLSRNIALLVALVALTQVCSLSVLLHYVQRPPRKVERSNAAAQQRGKNKRRRISSSPFSYGLRYCAAVSR